MKHISNWFITLGVCIGQRIVTPEDGWPTLIQFTIVFMLLTIIDQVEKR